MKTVIKMASIGLMAFAIAGVQLQLHAQEGTAPETREEGNTTARSLPFHGKLKALDRDAGTVTVGNRTFTLTPETTYLQGGLEAARIGEPVGGSYWKDSDGTLRVRSIRFGPKPGKDDPATEE